MNDDYKDSAVSIQNTVSLLEMAGVDRLVIASVLLSYAAEIYRKELLIDEFLTQEEIIGVLSKAIGGGV